MRNLITEWRRLDLPVGGETVVVGVSGGADSVSLLLALCELERRKKHDLRLVAAHFNHQLRGAESDADEEFVRDLTIKHEIEFATAKADAFASGNLEQNARRARYAFLSKTAGRLDAFAVLTGHTVNDQAETFLLNLVRGSGVAGLCGMREIRVLEDGEKGSGGVGEKRSGGVGGKGRKGGVEEKEESDGAVHETTSSPLLRYSPSPPLLLYSSSPVLLIRPLLKWAKREHTEGYCRDSGIEYRYDTMNEDTAFKRVRIRKILLPLLEDMNPSIIETLASTASLMQNARELCEAETTGDDELALADLKALSKARLYSAIRSWLGRRRGMTRRLEMKHIEAIARLISSTKSGRVAELPGGRVTKTGGRLVYDDNKVENSDSPV